MINWHGLAVLRELLWNILGATLVLAGVALVAVTARGELYFNQIAAEHGGQVIDLGRGAVPQAGQYGHMVRVVGTPRVVEAPRDQDFNLSADTPVLTRHVEMFEWREVHVGDSVHYEQDWMDHWLDAQDFREPQGHANPDRFPVQDQSFDAGRVQIDGFRLAPVLQRALPGQATVVPDLSALPANLAASFVQHGNYLQSSALPDNPQLGDIRISWDEIPLRMVTVVARLDGDLLQPAEGVVDGQGYQIALGDVGVRELFPDLPTAPEVVPLKRVLGLLLAMLGAFVLLSVRRRAIIAPTQTMLRRRQWSDLVLAMGLGALAVGAVASTVWAGHDILHAVWWAGVALLGTLLSVWQWYSVHR